MYASIPLTAATLNASRNKFLDLAIAAAKEAEQNGDVPVGAVVVYEDRVIATAFNERERSQDPTSHAEVTALRKAAEIIGSWRLLNCDLFVTLEPCLMCTGALIHARIRSVYFGATDPKAGACGSVFQMHDSPQLNHRFQAVYLQNEECSSLLTEFFKRKRV